MSLPDAALGVFALQAAIGGDAGERAALELFSIGFDGEVKHWLLSSTSPGGSPAHSPPGSPGRGGSGAAEPVHPRNDAELGITAGARPRRDRAVRVPRRRRAERGGLRARGGVQAVARGDDRGDAHAPEPRAAGAARLDAAAAAHHRRRRPHLALRGARAAVAARGCAGALLRVERGPRTQLVAPPGSAGAGGVTPAAASGSLAPPASGGGGAASARAVRHHAHRQRQRRCRRDERRAPLPRAALDGRRAAARRRRARSTAGARRARPRRARTRRVAPRGASRCGASRSAAAAASSSSSRRRPRPARAAGGCCAPTARARPRRRRARLGDSAPDGAAITCVCVLPSAGHMLLTGSAEGELRLWPRPATRSRASGERRALGRGRRGCAPASPPARGRGARGQARRRRRRLGRLGRRRQLWGLGPTGRALTPAGYFPRARPAQRARHRDRGRRSPLRRVAAAASEPDGERDEPLADGRC